MRRRRGSFGLGVLVTRGIWRFGIRIVLTPLTPTGQCRKEGLDHGIARVGMEQRRGEPAHQVLRFQPEVFVSHCTPKPDDHLAVEIAGSTRQSVHLLGTPNLQPTEYLELWAIVKLGLGGYVIGRSAEKIVEAAVPPIAGALRQ